MAIHTFETSDVRAELIEFGCRLIELMSRPDTIAHVRTVLAACAKFPQLGRAFYEAGPCFGAGRVSAYLRRMNDEGILHIADVERAAWQFLELCQSGTFKPLLFCMVDELTRPEIEAGVKAGVEVFMTAYGAPKGREAP